MAVPVLKWHLIKICKAKHKNLSLATFTEPLHLLFHINTWSTLQMRKQILGRFKTSQASQWNQGLVSWPPGQSFGTPRKLFPTCWHLCFTNTFCHFPCICLGCVSPSNCWVFQSKESIFILLYSPRALWTVGKKKWDKEICFYTSK